MNKETEHILSIDSSTSSSKVEIYSTQGKLVFSAMKEHEIISPQPGWAENDPNQLIINLYDLLESSKESGKAVKTIGICNQRETIVVWRRSTSELLNNAVLWCDTRTKDICEKLVEKYGRNRDHFKKITGLPISTYFSAFKIRWLLDNSPSVKKAYDEDDVCFGNVNTWLLWNLTQGQKFLTDVSNACRTFLMDLSTLDYSESLLDEFGIKRSTLPDIIPTFAEFGTVSIEKGGLKGTSINCMFGDQQAATFGHGIITPGRAKNTYGTGAFLLVNTGTKLITDCPGIIASVYYQVEGQPATYCLEGAIECGANVLNWMKDSMNIFSDFTEINKNIPKDPSGVYFLPAFGGLFSPFWENSAGSIIFGSTLHTRPGDLFRAALEGVAYRTKDCISVLNRLVEIKELVVDGGITRSQFILEFQQKIIGIKVLLSDNHNCTVFGAALGAGISKGLITIEDVPPLISGQQEITPSGQWNLSDNYGLWKELCKASISLGNIASSSVKN